MHVEKIEILNETLRRVSATTEEFSVDIAALEAGWFSASELAEPDSAALANALDMIQQLYPEADTRTCAALFINEYAWYVPAVAIAAFLLEKRVPDLRLSNLALCHRRYTWESMGRTGEASRIDVRFLSGDFAALHSDTDAALAKAQLLPDVNALREWLRETFEAQMQPIIERTYQLSGLSRGALWRIVADSCSAVFLQVGNKVNQADEAQQQGLAFVKVPNSPMNNPQLQFISLSCGNYSETFRARGGCCRFYTLPDRDYCTTCVLRKPQEQKERLLAYVEYKAQNNA
jgi:hypothetical protein